MLDFKFLSEVGQTGPIALQVVLAGIVTQDDRVSAGRSESPSRAVALDFSDPITVSAPFERVDLVAVRTTKARRKGAER